MVWNLFAQLLFPLIMILSFISVLDISKRDDVVKNVNADKEKLQDVLVGISTTREVKAKIAEWRNIYEQQRFKLLQAWERIRNEERDKLFLNMFTSGERVILKGIDIDDTEFLALCEGAKQLFDKGEPVQIEYMTNLYRRVLEEAGITDASTNPREFSVHLWPTDSTKIPDIPFAQQSEEQQSQLAVIEAKNIHPANRAFVHNQIWNGVNGFKNETEEVQGNVLSRIFDQLLASPEKLDTRAEKLVEAILSPSTMAEERRRKANEFYEGQGDWIRDRLESNGYHLLVRTWNQIKSIQ